MAGSAQIRQLRRRIKSVKSTQKITRAMEMIAASRIRRAQRRVQEARPYAEQITEVIRGLAASNDVSDHPLLRPHEDITDVGVIVITSDRGLAGAYNSNILRLAEKKIREEEQQGNEVHLYQVGKKGVQYFKYRGRTPVQAMTDVSDQPDYTDAQAVGQAVMDAYADEELDRVWLLYTDFQSALSQKPNAIRLLPVEPEELYGGDEISPEVMFEPNPDEILELLIPRYVEAKVFAGMLESAASEHAMRQRAMKSATDNAEEVVEDLSREMNQARQDQITTEITEIVGGAEALSQGG
ncbi:MAG: F0F1 ATP synthase subunit gamma [Nitriliruptorales bacterium]|nr:F0F1 ATP synthase subunit gamma [Nitriliruptorales bacterium]